MPPSKRNPLDMGMDTETCDDQGKTGTQISVSRRKRQVDAKMSKPKKKKAKMGAMTEALMSMQA